MTWLFKEEPTHYSYDDLVREGKTRWSGVRNPLAQKHLHAVRKGDRILYYHTGDVKAIVALARAASDAYPDPADPTGKAAVVDVAPDEPLRRAVTLAEVRANPAFAMFPLVRMPRLSVMPVEDALWKEIERMSKG
jgi:predicted RNA-binding protein with PUA-like domain